MYDDVECQNAGANAGRRFQFRFRGSHPSSDAAQLTLDLDMRRLLLLILLLPFALAAAPPKFESYPVTLHPIKKFAQTQIPKTGLDWKMEDYLRYSDKEPLSFADKYTLFDIGCGTGCVEYCLIDRTTGVVNPGTDFTQDFPRDYHGPFGLQFRRNSRLLVVYHAVGFHYPVHVSYYILDGTKMKLLQSDEIQATKRSNKARACVKTPALS